VFTLYARRRHANTVAMPARTLVLGDVHLTRQTPADVTGDLVRLFDGAVGERVIVAGDFFDLATDAPRAQRARALADLLGTHAALRMTLARFLELGGQFDLLGGNHDSAIGDAALASQLGDILELSTPARSRLRTLPWFLRVGGAHIEHGHCYDPDNAPSHPLIDGERSLGVHFSAEFIHPTQAHRFLQANDATPLNLLLAAFRWYGPRAPYVIYRYFRAAFAALAKAGPFYRAHDEKRHGEERLARFAEDAGLPIEIANAVLAIRTPSTLESWSATFARLYMDRVLATLALGAGVPLIVRSSTRRAGAGALGVGAMLMALSWLHGHNRYRGTVLERLERAAQEIVLRTGAAVAVFGHTHCEALREGYANTGSFSWPGGAPGRPYLEISDDGGTRVERRYLEAR
jgi:predicted phosphodiesterase